MFTKPVTVYEIITFNLSKWSLFESISFQKYANIMCYNVAEYVIASHFIDLHDDENGGFISKPCTCGPSMRCSNGQTLIHTHTQTHAHTHTDTRTHTHIHTYTHTDTHTHTQTHTHTHTYTHTHARI